MKYHKMQQSKFSVTVTATNATSGLYTNAIFLSYIFVIDKYCTVNIVACIEKFAEHTALKILSLSCICYDRSYGNSLANFSRMEA